MAMKSSKNRKVRRSSKSAAAAKKSQPAKKTAVKKTRRAGASHVRFGVHGMTRIVKTIREAGLEQEFNEAMNHDDKFVAVKRESLNNLRKFVESKPELTDLASEMRQCDCPPDDPYCIYI